MLHLRFRVTGTGPTALSGKAWFGAAAEPAAWQIQATDATASLQRPGGVGVHVYLSSSATNAPVTVTADNLPPAESKPCYTVCRSDGGTRRVVPRHWRALRARRASGSPKFFIAREV